MGRLTEVAIATVPVALCLGVFYASTLNSGPLPVPDGSPRALSAASEVRPQAKEMPTIAGTPLPAPAPQLPSVAVTTPPSPEPSATVLDPLTRGRELAGLLYAQQLAALWNTFQPALQQEWGGLSSFTAYRKAGRKTYGGEKRVLAEVVRRSNGVSYYTRTATFQRGPRGPWTLIFGLDDAGRVVAFNIVAAGLLPAPSL